MLDFRKAKYLATSLVVFVGVLYFFAQIQLKQESGPLGVWAWVSAFAEAALVGALADWFAVTALFRRPLGLPFPHSAIVPRNQARIGHALGEFVQSNFLSETVVSERVARLQVGDGVSEWLALSENREFLAKKLSPILLGTLRAFDDVRLREALGAATGSMLRMLDAPSAGAHALEVLLGSPEQQVLLDQLLKTLEQLIKQHELELREALRKEMPWYVPGFVHNKVYRDVLAKILSSLREANADSAHKLRVGFSKYVARMATELRVSTPLREKTQAAWGTLLASEVGRQYVGVVAQEVRAKLTIYLSDKPEVFENVLCRWLSMLADSLQQSESLRLSISDLATKLAQGISRNYRHEIAALVSETVTQWDPKTLVERLEAQVGKDLQFIRINGTLVGGILGLILHALKL